MDNFPLRPVRPDAPTHVRIVALLPDERAVYHFSAQEGLQTEPPAEGQLLTLTNQRIIAFSTAEDADATVMAPVDDLRAVILKSGGRAGGSLAQGLIMVVGGFFVYLVAAYWFTGRFQGPTVPILNMDLGPVVILLVVIWGAFLAGKYYFQKQTGSLALQGTNWSFTFPYKTETAGEDAAQLASALLRAARGQLNLAGIEPAAPSAEPPTHPAAERESRPEPAPANQPQAYSPWARPAEPPPSATSTALNSPDGETPTEPPAPAKERRGAENPPQL